MTDLAALDAYLSYLSSDDSPEECVMLSDLDGFLHGVACSPAAIPVEEWMPVALGSTSKKVPSWVREAIHSLYLDILEGLIDGPPEAEPIFWQAKEGHFITKDWCEGFMDAVKLRPNEWMRLIESGIHGQLIIPIMVHLQDENASSMMDIPQEQLEQTLSKAAEMIPQSVVGIHLFWLETWSGEWYN